ncbi:gag-protease polyprotein [Cucumis melo var. makuwa]|uniref:Gag-protease polyprotein n=1 Tax=Cucumis melo var. makuwa TaxID=1194695 RepID=A0A5A7TRF7_CUCMM|nr:gag-protease polyprotein [Cucumis melo var. makuwa]TYK13603.1 gag-protease polyprotein [Cucumis melo var. makuwa]
MDDPTKAQMWLTSVEIIFSYMKCPNNQKIQSVVFFSTDRGATWWETIERMLGGDVNQITWEQLKENFYAKFFSASMRDEAARIDKFVSGLRLDLQGFVRAFRLAHADALRLTVDMSLHERMDQFNVVGKWSTSRQKRKAEQQPAGITPRDSSSGGTFHLHQQEVTEVGGATKELPSCRVCGRNHSDHCVAGKRICFRCKQEWHLANKLWRLELVKT